MARDIVDVALGEVGYAETGNNLTKYGQWMCMNGYAWCHMFVSWCAAQAGEADAVPYTASCAYGISWYTNRGKFQGRDGYTPKRGDIIYFGNGSHVGIVERADSGMVYTVEGNSSNRVAQRSYSLNDGKITGYGVPAYSNLNGTGNYVGTGSLQGSDSSEKKKISQKELFYLRQLLARKEQEKNQKKKKVERVTCVRSREVERTKNQAFKRVTVLITNGKKRFYVPVKEGMKVVWERKGTPGKLTFETQHSKKFKITEGCSVLVAIGGKKFFYGFIFSRTISKDGMVSCTAYDQLRYLKNKDTMIYSGKRADQVVKMIAEKFRLSCGKLDNTEYRYSAIEDDETLFDIIQNALDETLMIKNKVYVLYDQVGKLRLTDIARMKVNSCIVDKGTGEDFSYKASIDEGVYNQIKLIYENKDKGSYDYYMTKHSKNINKWGVLQYTEKIENPDIGKLKSQALLQLYNKKQRTLTVSGVIGNKKVRAGSLVPVILNLYDIKVSNYMLVERVTHTFEDRRHSMELVLSGGNFSG